MGIFEISDNLTPALVQTAGSFIGAHQNRGWARAQQASQENFQREVLQNQLQWRVADAKAAGLHPLAALGVSPATGAISAFNVDSGIPNAFGAIAKGISDFGDAVDKNATKEEQQRLANVQWQEHLEDRQMTKAEREMDMRVKQAQIDESLARIQHYAKMPLTVDNKNGNADDPSKVKGYADGIWKYGTVDLPSGETQIVPSQDYKQLYEDLDVPGSGLVPIVSSTVHDWANRIGFRHDMADRGYKYDWRRSGWVKDKSPHYSARKAVRDIYSTLAHLPY